MGSYEGCASPNNCRPCIHACGLWSWTPDTPSPWCTLFTSYPPAPAAAGCGPHPLCAITPSRPSKHPHVQKLQSIPVCVTKETRTKAPMHLNCTQKVPPHSSNCPIKTYPIKHTQNCTQDLSMGGRDGLEIVPSPSAKTQYQSNQDDRTCRHKTALGKRSQEEAECGQVGQNGFDLLFQSSLAVSKAREW